MGVIKAFGVCNQRFTKESVARLRKKVDPHRSIVPKQQAMPLPSSVNGIGSSVTGATGTDAVANGTTG